MLKGHDISLYRYSCEYGLSDLLVETPMPYFNNLSSYILHRKSETLPIFKTRLKTYLFRHYYD